MPPSGMSVAGSTAHQPNSSCVNCSLTGIPFMGNILKLGRPSKYQGPSTPCKNWQMLTGQAQDTGMPVPDPETKTMRELFIGNTQPGTSETHLQEFLGDKLQQIGLTVAPGNPIVATRVSMKFAFIELRSTEEADLMLNLNGIPYLGMPLKVGRPTKYQGPPVPSVSWDELIRKIMTGAMSSLPEYVCRVLPQPSPVVKLANMVTLGDLREDTAYQELQKETNEECGR